MSGALSPSSLDTGPQAAPVPAAQYVRMSTDHQKYSTANQAAALQRYAELHGMVIVRTYADEGKSGLRLAGRDGLKQLIADVQDGTADFEVLLVFDVSRWGRFQDADESAYYEYLCRRAGVRVVYCAEPFENDGTPIATIVKSVKRAMAGEFSRELSAKVMAGQLRLVRLGFKQGGPAGLGYRRLLLDSAGRPKAVLERGQRKSLQDDRVVLTLGPPEEIATVQEIFQRFVTAGENCERIAAALNRRGAPGGRAGRWTRSGVVCVLTNEKYIGNTVFGRTTNHLKQRLRRLPPETWVRMEGTHPPLVSPELFAAAAIRFAATANRQSNEDLLDELRALQAKHGRLSRRLIDAWPGLPSAETIANRFGGIDAAYERVGYRRPRGGIRGRRVVNAGSRKTAVVVRAVGALRARGAVVRDLRDGVFEVNGEFTFRITAARPLRLSTGAPKWKPRIRSGTPVDFRVVARLEPIGEEILDYFIFPALVLEQLYFNLPSIPPLPYRLFQFPDLGPLLALAERAETKEAL